MMPYLTPEQARALRTAEAHRRALRRRIFLDRCRTQALEAKARLIVAPKGKNGRSMSAELLEQHGIYAPATTQP